MSDKKTISAGAVTDEAISVVSVMDGIAEEIKVLTGEETIEASSVMGIDEEILPLTGEETI